jgi:hypothetical protein
LNTDKIYKVVHEVLTKIAFWIISCLIIILTLFFLVCAGYHYFWLDNFWEGSKMILGLIASLVFLALARYIVWWFLPPAEKEYWRGKFF